MERKENIEINKYFSYCWYSCRFELTKEGTAVVRSDLGLITSYSGADKWVHQTVCNLLSFYSGKSPYNYTLDCVDFTQLFEKETPEEKDKCYAWVEESLNKPWAQLAYSVVELIIDKSVNL